LFNVTRVLEELMGWNVWQFKWRHHVNERCVCTSNIRNVVMELSLGGINIPFVHMHGHVNFVNLN